ncbi:MAG: hypothetical protein QOE11_3025 [Solirubrobacteraceae bacterium]|nr:hypothetical protein [Solirubrobacteraceae bacterium]
MTDLPERWWARLGWALPFAVVVPMLALANALGIHAIIFPEGAALVMGVWVLRLPGWAASRWRVAALPPLCALAGTLIVRAQLPSWGAAILGCAVALLVLQSLDSRLAPALSAAALPIVFDVPDWSYPLAVLVICLLISGAMPWLARRRGQQTASPHDLPGRYPWAVAAAGLAAIAAWILLGGELLALPVAALAPPLFVSALEWLGQGTCTLRRGMRRWLLLVAVALAGALAADLVDVTWIAGAIAIAAALVLMWLLSAPHPPALAIALIPQILDTVAPLAYAAAIAVGAGALYLAMLALDRFAGLTSATATAGGP